MPETTGLRFGDIPPCAVHLCVDIQRMFTDGSPWATPWIRRVLPQIVRLCEHAPARTCFTRFIPLRTPEAGEGAWRRYYERWPTMTLDVLGDDMVALLPELELFRPPASVYDKRTFSPWHDGGLQRRLRAERVDTLIVSGGETDVCVLATVLGAIDHGYRVIVAVDALCSSVNDTHDATLEIYNGRFGQQLESALVDEIRASWRTAG